MNNYDFIPKRNREQHLLIVEGNHEKNELLDLLLRCFPEINIKPENIVIYGTNTYDLHTRIVKEYGKDWADIDVDLPYVVSKMKQEETWYKDNFINIFLFFDYERQDPYFSDETIQALQRYFLDETDVGKLYINYPMVESYWDSFDSPDSPFRTKKVGLPFKNGNEYKSQTGKSQIAQEVQFPDMLDDVLKERFEIRDGMVRQNLINQLLDLNGSVSLAEEIEHKLKGKVNEESLQTAKYFLQDKILKAGYIRHGVTYYEFMRREFCEIICRNIRKASMIQTGEYDIPESRLRESFYDLNPLWILDKQNTCSRDSQNGFIWVLNTSVFIVPDYAFNLIISGQR